MALGSAASIGFGIWHFFVPRIWDWYSYIDVSATELVLAVRAINVFFSLSLVLFGLMNLLMAYGRSANRYSVLVVLGATCVLWAARVVMQLVYPQGSRARLFSTACSSRSCWCSRATRLRWCWCCWIRASND